MPRKQNGFGSPTSFGKSKSFDVSGVNSRTDKGKGRGAAGFISIRSKVWIIGNTECY